MRAFSFYLLFFSLSLFVSSAFANEGSGLTTSISAGDTAWMLVSAAFVLLMTPGLSFFYGGMVRPKNVVSTMLQSFICMGIVSILWYLFGFSLVFGDSIYGIIGNPTTYFLFKNVGELPHAVLSPNIPFLVFALFQLKFAIITPALVTGALAERVNFNAYVIFVVLFEVFIYAPLAHMTWHPDGLLHKMGVLDFAGGTVVHMSAGVAALIGAYFLGSRWTHNQSKLVHSPANVPFILLGTSLLWFGWFGFNAGSALGANGLSALSFATTHFASAAAMLTWISIDLFRGKKISMLGACVGAIVGLVAITPGAGFVTVGSSILIGMIASGVSQIAVHFRNQLEFDDTLDVFPCHGVGGIVGMILTGVFAQENGLIAGKMALFSTHLIVCVMVFIGVAVVSYVLYWVVDKMIDLRVSSEDETRGLDLSLHNESALSLEEVVSSES